MVIDSESCGGALNLNGSIYRIYRIRGIAILDLGAGAGVPDPRHILPEPVPELENSGKNSGRQNYEKLFHISTNIWH
jgi:hypothetical protein